MYIKENIPQCKVIVNNPIGTGRVLQGSERERITVKYKIYQYKKSRNKTH